MSDRRDFGRNAKQMREALEQYSREDLLDLLTHLVRVYVIEGDGGGGVGVETEPSSSMGLEALSELTFAQVVLHLQMNLPHEALRQIQVSGERVWVTSGGVEIDLVERRPQEAPPDAEMIERDLPTRESVGEDFGQRDVREPTRGERAVTGPVVPEAEPVAEPVAPREGTPRSRQSVGQTPSTTARDAGRIPRPSSGLRGQPSTLRTPPPAADQDRDAGPSPRRGGSESLGDSGQEGEDVGDISDRFSMLELD